MGGAGLFRATGKTIALDGARIKWGPLLLQHARNSVNGDEWQARRFGDLNYGFGSGGHFFPLLFSSLRSVWMDGNKFGMVTLFILSILPARMGAFAGAIIYVFSGISKFRQKSLMPAATALAYFRTSSAANVGADKDSLTRQKAAVIAYAKARRIAIVEEFYDAAVSGADPIEDRPGFLAMLSRISGNGVRCILVETANRFARDLAVQETGWRFLQAKGIELV